MADRFCKIGGSNLLDGQSLANAWETAIFSFTNMGPSNRLKFSGGSGGVFDVDRPSTYTPIPSGEPGSPSIITDNGDGPVTFHHPGSGPAGIIFFGTGAGVRTPTPEYITFIGTARRQLVFDGEYTGDRALIYMANSAINHIRFEKCEIKDSFRSGVLGSGCDTCTFHDCDIHGNGSEIDANNVPHDHGIYASGPNFTVTGCRIYNNSGWGIHAFRTSNEIYPGQNYSDNVVYGNGYGEGTSTGSGILVKLGTSPRIVNNVCYKNAGAGIQLWRPSNGQVLHNTCHENGQFGIDIGRGDGTTSGTVIGNNTLIGNGSGPLRLLASCTGTVVNWNRIGSGESLNTSGDPGATVTNNTANAVATQAESGGYSGEWEDPTNATLADRDYHLKAGAKSIAPSGITDYGVTTDADGATRENIDQGAYAFGTLADIPPINVVDEDLITQVNVAFSFENFSVIHDNDLNRAVVYAEEGSFA